MRYGNRTFRDNRPVGGFAASARPRPDFQLISGQICRSMARPDKLPRVLTEEETDRLLSQPNQRHFGPHRDYLYMRLMLKAGLRGSEATALRPEHIDLMSGKLMVRSLGPVDDHDLHPCRRRRTGGCDERALTTLRLSFSPLVPRCTLPTGFTFTGCPLPGIEESSWLPRPDRAEFPNGVRPVSSRQSHPSHRSRLSLFLTGEVVGPTS
ncbi:integrase [Salinibacter ruber]|jgi:integrase|nr:integrase [Salinibacter ruber]